MTSEVRRPLWLALGASLTLHAGALTAPGWGLPMPDDETGERIEARLTPAAVVPAPHPVAAPPSKSRPHPRPKSRPETPASADTMPVAAVPSLPVPTAPDPVADEPLAPRPEPATLAAPADAVPPAPTIATRVVGRWPRSGRIVYQVTRGEGGMIVGESRQEWQHDGVQYELRTVTETTGLAALFHPASVEQTSQGAIDDRTGLQPRNFASRRGEKRQEVAEFDRIQGRVSFNNGRSAAMLPDTQDLLSLFHQLGGLPPDGREWSLMIATGRKLARYRVTLADEGLLDSALGQQPARHFVIAGDARDEVTEVWVDANSGLPLKIRHRDRKGENFDQLATHIDVKDPP